MTDIPYFYIYWSIAIVVGFYFTRALYDGENKITVFLISVLFSPVLLFIVAVGVLRDLLTPPKKLANLKENQHGN